ncbi:MAG: DNA polymerase [Chloroflexi bacterium]|jgi:uracil-DNA glycosylase family 4|nr:MAG: DNA polymerase [Chloroflexota bacterium]|tara:strand:+ start:5884 stop:6450 length:567 start_codon:yes stop_codon:yes gene_type:complete
MIKSINKLNIAIKSCTLCMLSQNRINAVPGTGNIQSNIMLIGEAPGKNEDQIGMPFTGTSGKYLDKLLSIASLNRELVFITNLVKCKPPSNRDPLLDEITACSTYLNEQINIIKPKLIITLGRYSLKNWMPRETISNVHGTYKKIDNFILVPMYHPAAAMYRGSLRKIIENDYVELGKFINTTNRIGI